MLFLYSLVSYCIHCIFITVPGKNNFQHNHRMPVGFYLIPESKYSIPLQELGLHLGALGISHNTVKR
jgi:hypothetical protein